jgi:hypothetical protein
MVWIKKPDADLTIPIKKWKGIFSLTFVLMLIFMIITDKIGYHKFASTIEPKTWAQVFSHLPIEIVFAAIFAALVSIFPKTMGFKSVETVMCDKCEKVKTKDSVHSCECGGKYFPLKMFEWKET